MEGEYINGGLNSHKSLSYAFIWIELLKAIFDSANSGVMCFCGLCRFEYSTVEQLCANRFLEQQLKGCSV